MKPITSFFLLMYSLSVVPVVRAQSALDAPENAYYHAPTKSWFVSSLGGGKVTLEKDGFGWVSRLNEKGEVTAARWVEGLDAPTGMAATNGLLYVGDRGVVVEIDVAAAKVLRKIPLEGSEFVNDVAAAPNGDVYISDTFTNRIYRLPKGGKPEVFLQSEKLEYPNGLLVDGDRLVVATWGPMTNRATFETSRKGTVLTVSLKDKSIKPLGEGKPIANLDGIVKLGNNYFATDWTGGRLLMISPMGEVTEVLKGFNQLADLGVDPATGTLCLPEMSSNRVFMLRVPALAGKAAR